MQNYDLDNFEPAAKIVVIGVGGAGNNAVNRMIDEEIANVDFWVANTDKQALSTSKAPNRLILGQDITGGLGAGENQKSVKKLLKLAPKTSSKSSKMRTWFLSQLVWVEALVLAQRQS